MLYVVGTLLQRKIVCKEDSDLSSAVFWSVERNPLTGEHVASLGEVKCKNGMSHERGFGPSPSMTF